VGLAGSAGDEAELGLGGDGVDDGRDGGALVVGELAEVGEAGVQVAAGGVQGPPGRVLGYEVVDAGVEGLGDADDGFKAGGDAPVLVAETWRASLPILSASSAWDRPASARSSRSRSDGTQPMASCWARSSATTTGS
jgi:hypothetical protein